MQAKIRAGVKVLLIEDDGDIASLLSEVLSSEGCIVHIASTGEAGIELLRASEFDVVLTDVMLKGITGLQVLARAQALGWVIPFVIMTGYSNAELIIDAVRLGATDFLRKPFEIGEMLSVVKRASSISERQRSIDELLQQLAEGAAPQTSDLLEDLRRQIAMLRVLGAQKPPV